MIAEPLVGSGLVEYETISGEFWGVQDFTGLASRFSIGAGDLAEWHDFVSRMGRAWDVVARLHGVASLVTENDDEMRLWKLKELAAHYGAKEKQLDLEVAAAVRAWAAHRARGVVDREAVAGISEDEFKKLTSFTRMDGLGEGMTEELLTAFNFDDVKDELLRATVAQRILSLREYLTGHHTRTQARQLIRLEISIHTQERLQSRYQNEIDDALALDPKLVAGGNRIEDLREKIKEIEKEMRTLLDAHTKLAKAIGADETDLTARKVVIVDTMAYVMELCLLFESDPANWKPDGIFTAGEIEWLTEPLGERPPQYRPDIVLRMREALAPENLWNPDYQPTPIQQRVVQKLRRAFELATGEIGDPDAKPDRERDEDDEDTGDKEMAEGAPTPMVDVPDAGEHRAFASQFAAADTGGDVMGVY